MAASAQVPAAIGLTHVNTKKTAQYKVNTGMPNEREIMDILKQWSVWRALFSTNTEHLIWLFSGMGSHYQLCPVQLGLEDRALNQERYHDQFLYRVRPRR